MNWIFITFIAIFSTLVMAIIIFLIALLKQGDERYKNKCYNKFVLWSTWGVNLRTATGDIHQQSNKECYILFKLAYSHCCYFFSFSILGEQKIWGVIMKNCIQELRKTKKLSQEELAKLCNVTRQTINAIENNKYDPTLSLAFCLAKVLGSTVDNLFSLN